MKSITKEDLLILVPDSADERAALARWRRGRDGHVLLLLQNAGSGTSLRFEGPREHVCREPITITSRHPVEHFRLISNVAATPFELDGKNYASVDSFWQGLKFLDPAERARIASLDGPAARRAAVRIEYESHICYDGRQIPVGTWDHWQLLERACRAKFQQNAEAMSALASTGDRPLVYKGRRESRTLPGVILADIWMRIRHEFRAAARGGELPPDDDNSDELFDE